MINELERIINNENKKKPLTDKEIAKKMNLSREKITLMRKENGIPSSKVRMKPLLKKEIEKILTDNKNISKRKLTQILQDKGFAASRHIVRKEYDLIIDRENKAPENNQVVKEENCFSNIIGAELSLKTQIQQAKAAVLYPPHGLHTLIIGESGVGKSYLAEQMYRFAVQENKIKNDKFVVFNCADYAENPQLLYSHLFGHKKGSFTGAEKDKDGLIKRADNGILFLDEVHRLSSEGQEMLFNVIDNGFYRKLGETDNKEKINLMIIAATTEDIKSNLLATFRRRIPLIIDLPPLNKRSLEEKLKFIKHFISRESRQIEQKIILKYEAARALLSFEPENNIGQLESKIKEICARAYLNFISSNSTEVKITLDLFNLKIQRSFFEGSVNREDIKKLIKNDIILSPEQEEILKMAEKNKYKFDNNIYKYLEEKNKELYSLGFTKEEINQKLNELLAEKVKNVFSQAEESLFEDGKLLNELVDNKVLDMVNDVLVIIHRELPEYVLNNRLKYAIAMHLDAVIERIKSGKIIKHPDLEEIKKSNNKLYNISKKIIKYLNEEYRLQIPRDEVGYITMYLNNLDMNQSPNRTSAQPAIIVISHGGVASEMLKVANWLIGDSKAKAIDMHLDQPPMQILDELIYTAKKIDQGKGILLLVDMGSLKSFGDVITERTGIKTRVIPRVDTVMLMEAIRWAKFDNLELDDLVSRIYHSSNKYSRTKRKEVILIYCITGEGAALRVKDYLINRIPELENQHEIITTGIHDKNINHYINKLEKNYNLNAVIGNLKPDRQVNNFYDFEKIYSEAGFDRFIEKLNLKNKLKSKNNPQLLLNKNLIYLKPKVKNKEEALKFLSQKLIRAGVVKESYYKAVKEKENWSVTYVGDGIAIPHADSKHVNYSQFALAILEEKIEWSGFKVDVICMFAFKDLETENFRKFYSKLKKKLSYIKKAEEIEVVKEALING